MIRNDYAASGRRSGARHDLLALDVPRGLTWPPSSAILALLAVAFGRGQPHG
jgi:hypothetical protein